jgi:hypothetical protein
MPSIMAKMFACWSIHSVWTNTLVNIHFYKKRKRIFNTIRRILLLKLPTKLLHCLGYLTHNWPKKGKTNVCFYFFCYQEKMVFTKVTVSHVNKTKYMQPYASLPGYSSMLTTKRRFTLDMKFFLVSVFHIIYKFWMNWNKIWSRNSFKELICRHLSVFKLKEDRQ